LRGRLQTGLEPRRRVELSHRQQLHVLFGQSAGSPSRFIRPRSTLELEPEKISV